MKKLTIEVETIYTLEIDFKDFQKAYDEVIKSPSEYREMLHKNAFASILELVDNTNKIKLFDLKNYWHAICNHLSGYKDVDEHFVRFKEHEDTDILKEIAKVLGYHGVKFYGYKKSDDTLVVKFYNEGCDL